MRTKRRKCIDRTPCTRTTTPSAGREQRRTAAKRTFFCDLNRPGQCSPTKKGTGSARKKIKARSLREAMMESWRRAAKSNRRKRP